MRTIDADAHVIETDRTRAFLEEHERQFRPAALITGGGTFAIRGSYDDVVAQFGQLHAAGLDGMAIALVDYLADLPALRDEVIPRLERAGFRLKANEQARIRHVEGSPTCHGERSTAGA